MPTNRDLKITIRCPEGSLSNAISAIKDFINEKRPGDGTAEGWIMTFEDGTSAYTKLTKAGNYSVVAWEADEKGRRVDD